MTTDEKFNEIYQKILNENANYMERSRGEAQSENRHKYMILIVIILVDIVIYYVVYKLFHTTRKLPEILLLYSMLIYYIKTKDIGRKPKIKKYTMDFKTRIVGTMIKSFEEQLEFTPQNRIISICFQRSRI